MARERVERGADANLASSQPSLSIAEIRQLITLMNGCDIEEIAIEREADGLKLILRKPAPASDSAPFGGADGDFDAHEPSEASGAGGDSQQPHAVEIAAPLVGIFRASMQPTGAPLVSVGDVVREGQVVAAIEALNVLNEVEASGNGRVREILASDGQAVEYGQPLLVLEP